MKLNLKKLTTRFKPYSMLVSHTDSTLYKQLIISDVFNLKEKKILLCIWLYYQLYYNLDFC